jgi:ubiquinone/menaquinone biosynthesis C-methylase UbiE
MLINKALPLIREIKKMITDVKNTQLPPSSKNTQYSQYAIPEYLVRHYWWAYLSPTGVSFFDHTFMVNKILWGQYHVIAQNTVDVIVQHPQQNVAAISCAYGNFFPKLAKHCNIQNLFIFDVAPIQIKRMQQKFKKNKLMHKSHFFLGNAEQIALQSDLLNCTILYFLLHELPPKSRTKVLSEAIRITKPNGRLIIADYAPLGRLHLFHRNSFFKYIFETLEPFLGDFWRCDLLAELTQQAKLQGRTISVTSKSNYWRQFYRLLELTIE